MIHAPYFHLTKTGELNPFQKGNIFDIHGKKKTVEFNPKPKKNVQTSWEKGACFTLPIIMVQ